MKRRKPFTPEQAERRGESDGRRGWSPSIARWEPDKGLTSFARIDAYWSGYTRGQEQRQSKGR